MKKISKRLLSRLSLVLAAIAIAVYVFPSHDQAEPVVANSTKYVHHQIVLLDNDMMLVPFTVQIQADLTIVEKLNVLLDMMKTDQNAASSFKGFLDRDLKLQSASIKNRTIDMDFNSAFLNYNKEHEIKILEALLFLARQFEDVNQVNLLVDHFKLQYMPMKNTVVSEPLTYKLGINNFLNQAQSINNSSVVVVYYVKNINGQQYLVPITKRIDKQKVTMEVLLDEIVARVFVSSLVEQPLHSKEVIFSKPPVVNKEELTLYFDPSILVEERTIDDLYIQLLLLSIRSNSNIKRVKIMVGDDAVGLGGMNDDFIDVDSILYNFLSTKQE